MDKGVVPPPGPEHIEALKKHFGHSEFRPTQWDIIYSILVKKQDCCAVMATGYGKSLCYQYPAVFTGGITLVISPLISLMQDQVLSLEVAGIPAVMLGSAQTAKKTAVTGILAGEYRVVYVTPEWCQGETGEEVLKQLADEQSLTLLAVDEAHCVSQWGFDFRPKYRNLGKLRQWLPNVPILAVTATATPKVREDIGASLRLRNPKMVVTSFDRPNLYFSVRLKDTDKDIVGDLERLMVKDQLVKKFPGPTIIYCPTKKMTEKVAEALSQAGINCGVYHAELSQTIRREVHQRFVRDLIPVVVATVAFGMGIDKPDVRLVIHYGAPKEIESYYQEVGRAGRDGLPSTCHVFYSSADYSVNKHFLSSLFGAFREHREKMLKLLQQYLETDQCRRKLIVGFFNREEAKSLPVNQRCCDNCSSSKIITVKQPELDLREDARKLLGAVRLLEGRFGLGVPIKFLMGNKKETRIRESLKSSPLYGSGKDDPENWWKALGRLLVREGLLEEKAPSNFGKNKAQFFMNVTDITEAGRRFLSSKDGDEPIVLIPTPEIKNIGGKKIRLAAAKAAKEKLVKLGEDRAKKLENTAELHSVLPSSAIELSQAVSGNASALTNQEALLQNKLYEELLTLRSKLAADTDCMPYMIANNKTLLEMAKLKPETMQQLATVEGFTQVKLDKFGQAFLNRIKEVFEQQKENAEQSPSYNSHTNVQNFAQETISLPFQKVKVPKNKEILYEDDELEEGSQMKENERDLWEEDIDESLLAGVVEDPTPDANTSFSQEETVSKSKEDGWENDDDWFLENEALNKSLVNAESGVTPSPKKIVKVPKRKAICYESDEETETSSSNLKKEPSLTKNSDKALMKKRLKKFLA